ncbi:hypothetical protein [Thalassobaculum litoreum]|uniref:hypothetical protein n=1 Tax=Thalassobaculum litoreum TaxID=420996 RepID=UPI001113E7D3|nr:hypothetical protein [Thalassobaculum litoreum]
MPIPSFRTVSIIAGMLAFAPSASAQLYCSQPIRPYCSTLSKPFSDTSETRECSEEIEDFKRASSTYRDCLKGLIEKSNLLSQRVSDGFLSRKEIEPALGRKS